MTQEINSNNKRIAKNTLMLYVRMFLIILVSLFSVRILLKELGEEGYGIYNVVGGVVILFSFLSNAMTLSIQRFFSYYIGKNDSVMLARAFSMSVNVLSILSLVVLCFAESFGLWLLSSYMKFPENSWTAVQWVYQCSVVTFIVQIYQIPYQATVISHERMSFYAGFSIIEVTLKFLAILLLFLFESNRLIVYSILLMSVSMLIWFGYYRWCVTHFPICRYRFYWNRRMFSEMFGFSGWNMLGGIGNIGASQGINILFNIFHGVTVNTAWGISNQVTNAVMSFVNNLQTAFNPQIIKSYAAEDRSYCLSLIFRSSRLSFLLIFILGLPIILCCPFVLGIWLGEVPNYAVRFTQLMIAFCMIDAFSGSLWTAAQASGRIRNYMLIIASLILVNIPVAYILLKLGLSPVWVIAFRTVQNLVISIVRIFYLRRLISFPVLSYLKEVMLPIVCYIGASLPVPCLLLYFATGMWDYALIMIFTGLECVLLGYLIVFSANERAFVREKLVSVFKREKI